MKRVLIVSPHFAPTNAADMQRIRLLLPYLHDCGWRAEVLAVRPEDVASPVDPWLVGGLPPQVRVHRVRALGLGWRRIPGLGTLTYRAIRSLARRGRELLQSGRFDLVYFSTTQFGVHVLGPAWRRRHGVPFVMDYQDPWVSDYYRTHPEVAPPGGRTKYAAVSYLARRTEPRVLAACSGVTAVSATYPQQLRERYPALMRDMPTLVAPFPGDDADLVRVASDPSIRQTLFTPHDGRLHWVYVGRGGGDMQSALRPLFLAVAAQLKDDPGLTERLCLHFIGTSYAAAGRGSPSVAPIAAQYGLQNIVSEVTDRIPYSTTLRCLLDADALIVPGSDDPGYTASKIYPYLLARKPLLAIFHEASSVVELIRIVGGGVVVPFANGRSLQETAEQIQHMWFSARQFDQSQQLEEAAFQPHTARQQATELGHFFERCLKKSGYAANNCPQCK